MAVPQYQILQLLNSFPPSQKYGYIGDVEASTVCDDTIASVMYSLSNPFTSILSPLSTFISLNHSNSNYTYLYQTMTVLSIRSFQSILAQRDVQSSLSMSNSYPLSTAHTCTLARYTVAKLPDIYHRVDLFPLSLSSCWEHFESANFLLANTK